MAVLRTVFDSLGKMARGGTVSDVLCKSRPLVGNAGMVWKNVDLCMRVAQTADVPSLQTIERNAVSRSAVLPETRFCLGLPARDEGEHRLAREGGLALIGDVDGTPVAFALAVPKDRRAHLLEIAVAQAQQGRGYGRRLIAAVEAWAQGSGFKEMTLITFRDMSWNAPFYQDPGYEVIEVGSDRPELIELIADERRAGFTKRRASQCESCSFPIAKRFDV